MSKPDISPGIEAGSGKLDLSHLENRVPSRYRAECAVGGENRSDATVATDDAATHMKSLRWNETDANKEDRQAKEKKAFDLEHPQRPLLETIFRPVSGWIKHLWGRF